jgi:hypothetical protein
MIKARPFAPLFVGAILAFDAAWASRSFTPAPKTLPVRTPLARLGDTAPPARVPAPKPIVATEMQVLPWSGPDASKGPVRLQTDLDVLAPLGDGASNAALWLADFTRVPKGARLDEFEVAKKRLMRSSPDGDILLADDPLLREAEPWADQARMNFYPDVFRLDGLSTTIPNLHAATVLARSWTARARSTPDAPSALDDARRAIRWGRLLRQDDVTIIQDLIGLACIRMGVDTLYDLARRRGDRELALAAALASGEVLAQRHRSFQILADFGLVGGDDDRGLARPTDSRVEALSRTAMGGDDRRYRLEAIVQLAAVRLNGTRGQRARAEDALARVEARHRTTADSSQARWARAVTRAELSRLLD